MADPLVRSKSPKAFRPAKAAAKARKSSKSKTGSRAAPETHAKADGYIPFRERFRAWWHGVEPAAVVKKGQKAKTNFTKRLIELDDKDDLPPQADWGRGPDADLRTGVGLRFRRAGRRHLCGRYGTAVL